jgi:hypothetical protein
MPPDCITRERILTRENTRGLSRVSIDSCLSGADPGGALIRLRAPSSSRQRDGGAARSGGGQSFPALPSSAFSRSPASTA